MQDQAEDAVREALAGLELEWQQPGPGLYSVTLPGTRKLTTACALQLGRHHLDLRAFVARRPDENHERVYRWLLERNLRLYAVRFTLDALGDIYLTARIARSAVTADEIDRLLGAVAETADSSFNTILELGFAESIRAEWRWRLSRGESTANLAAFQQFAPDHVRKP
ncbi:type III secretion system chaperone family protein [Microlunatus soli]|uniref:Putative sensory transduction regulator n=1 Tax=Microlunatus soli TaxID=630515 RepID=A0A1H1S209_9ACTN|nr:YbjN domain-containing protein [Microlunatus soli]SDS42011.1 Putative sensory transduction regulator [Microlunatus soli]